VEGIYGRLCELTLEDRRSYRRLEPGRADVIIGGASVLVVILRELEKEKFLISEKDMLDGLAITAAMKESGFHA
jgi:exopolyphosphatase/guanosine-5'-triphosphate,3'-diphosphate pyrophosphatase